MLTANDPTIRPSQIIADQAQKQAQAEDTNLPGDPTLNPDTAMVMSRFFKGLSDPTRFRILMLLVEKERNVSELVELLQTPQGRVSSHLGCLKWCGYVSARREGRWVYYRVSDERIKQMIQLAGGVVNDNYSNLISCTVL